MAIMERHKTLYPGVYYIISGEGTKKEEKIFYIRYRNKDGKLIEEKAGRSKLDDMTAAKANTRRAEKISGKKPSNEEKRKIKAAEKANHDKWTINKLWQEYENIKIDNKAFRTDKSRYDLYLKESFGGKEPAELLQFEIDKFRTKILKKKSPQTVKHILALLKRIINFGIDQGYSTGPPFSIKLPRVDNRKTEFLTTEELERLFKAIKEDKHPQAGNIMLMALYTGMRRGELFKLQWKDIDFQNSFILIREPKGGKSQSIPLNNGAREVLKNISKGKSPYVFSGNRGKKRSNINRAINEIKNAAKLPEDFRPLHGLRHTFASMLASSGQVDLYTLQKLLTHKDHRMTERYAHLHDDALKKAAGVAADLIDKSFKGDK